MKKNKILIGIPLPHGQEIPSSLKVCLTNLRGEHDILFMRDLPQEAYKGDRIYRIAKAREAIRLHMLKGSYTHLLFLDSDIQFPPETLEVLLSYDSPVVSHSYPMHYTKNSKKISNGLGCTLIRREVLEKVSFLEGISLNDNFKLGMKSEDVRFREKVRALSFKLLDISHKLELKHLNYDPDIFFLQWMEQIKQPKEDKK